MPLPRVRPDLAYCAGNGFWDKVEKGDDVECWPWKQSTASHGYGQTWDGKHVLLAHRVAWALYHRSHVPGELTVDHVCRNKVCCNPAHLRLLSNIENARDNGQSRKTHCPSGHPYSGANLRVNRHGHRFCRTCARERYQSDG